MTVLASLGDEAAQPATLRLKPSRCGTSNALPAVPLLTPYSWIRGVMLGTVSPGDQARAPPRLQARPSSRMLYTLARKVPAGSGGRLVNQMST
jgi:hypothetical protein